MKTNSNTTPTDDTLRRAQEAQDWLQARQGALDPAPGFLPASQRRLLARIHKEARRSWWDSTWANPRVRIVLNSASLVLLLVTFIVFNFSLFTAAQVALPGETLYPFKLGLENARLTAAGSDAQKASLHVAFARERSNELQALLLEGEYDYLEVTSIQVLQEADLANQHLLLASDMDPALRQRLAQDLSMTMEMQSLVLQALRSSIPANSQAVVDFLLVATH